jgi:small subunit ribosomal protein S5
VADDITVQTGVEEKAVAAAPVAPPPPQQPHQSRRRDSRGPRQDRDRDKPKSDLVEKVVFVNRCAKVVKGGRRFSFSALIVVGDQKGQVGYGFGKANEVADAIKKGTEMARKSMIRICMHENTIPHEVEGNFGGGRVILKPASPGTGLIAGGGVRAVVEAVGIRDILSKSLGSSNMANVVKATLNGLRQMRPRQEIMQRRGLSVPASAETRSE